MLPDGATLDPAFLAPAEAAALFAALVADTPWEGHVFRIYGRTVPMPRRIAWFGDHPYRYSGVTHPAAPMPPAVARLRDRAAAALDHPFNVVLLNLYRDGADSMGWHADDDYEAGDWTGVASVSLGGSRRFRLRRRSSPPASCGVDLPSGSLLFMPPGFQARWQHAVPKTARKVPPRLNLTFRWMTRGNAPPSS